EVVVHHDRIDESRAAAHVADAGELSTLAELSTGDGATAGETWAIINAPKTTSALAETVARLQPYVSALIVIGRSAAMSRAVNKELARGFGRVDVSPGVGKHRMIIATRPLSAPSLSVFPKHGTIAHPGVGELEVRAHGACFSGGRSDEGSTLLLDAVLEAPPRAEPVVELGRGAGRSVFPKHGTVARPGVGELEVRAHGACFSGVRSDEGSTLLLDAVIEASPAAESVFALGCGNGWLLTAVTRVTGAPRAVGVDVSKAAVASARATVEANGIDADIVTGDAADPDDPGVAQLGSFDLIVLNPPFHQGTAIETDTASAMMTAAAGHLAPDGVVITVFNTHLRYRDRLEAIIGHSEQLARNKKFTVVASRGRSATSSPGPRRR